MPNPDRTQTGHAQFRTTHWSLVLAAGSSRAPAAQDALTDITALGRVGEPAEVADVVAFLAGPDGRWMTGQNLRATGGLLV